jgi:hypothetical protein
MSTLSDPADNQSARRDNTTTPGEGSLHQSDPLPHQPPDGPTRFRAWLDQSDDLVFAAQVPSGRLLDVNESACRQPGYTAPQLASWTLYQAHGGQIRAESQVEQGATFTITLPLNHQPRDSSAQLVADIE